MKNPRLLTACLLASCTLLGAATETEPQVSITVEGEHRFIRANGLPDHPTGQFPGKGNPNRIGAQNYSFRVPANPVAAAKPTPLGMQPMGVAVNGVVFDPGANEWWNDDRSTGWQYEALGGGPSLGSTRTTPTCSRPDRIITTVSPWRCSTGCRAGSRRSCCSVGRRTGFRFTGLGASPKPMILRAR